MDAIVTHLSIVWGIESVRQRRGRHYQQGFSLLELSIVVLIIALMMGAVIGGQHIIRLAELRSIITEKEKYIAAVNNFAEKYTYLPGDFPDALKYWSSKPACPNTTPTAIESTRQTCNGNGDKVLAGARSDETYLFWQHLMLEGMVDGTFYGVNGALSTTHTIPGWNVPAGMMEGVGYTPFVIDDAVIAADGYYPGQYGLVLLYGKPVGTNYTYGTALSVTSAHAIDAKADDGMPATGFIRSPGAGYSHRILLPSPEPICTVDEAITENSRYDTSIDANCAMVFLTGFNG